MDRIGGRVLLVLVSVLGLGLRTFGQNYCDRQSVYDIPSEKLRSGENRLSFFDGAGIWRVGDCWWHSAMQRYAFLLADFRPSESRRSTDFYRHAIRRLAAGNQVVPVPGYKNIWEFSDDFQDDFERVLSDMHTHDIFAIGLISLFRLPPHPTDFRANRAALSKLLTQLSEGKLPLITFRGNRLAPNHAYLVIGKSEAPDQIIFDAIDSNLPQDVVQFTWDYGRSGFIPISGTARWIAGDMMGVAVTRSSEYSAYERAFRKYCEK